MIYVENHYVENQRTVSDWAAETFGPVGSNFRVATRANEEMAELLRAIGADASTDKIAAEIADVLIVAYRLADRLGIDLDELEVRGFSASPSYHATSTNNALASVLAVLANNPKDPFAGEDLTIAVQRLYRVALSLDLDLRAEVDKKMAINRARTWNLDGTGHGYHVRDKAAAP